MIHEMEIQLNQRRKNNHFRYLKTTHNLIDFSSNDYLGLARCIQFKKNVQKEWDLLNTKGLNGLGSTGSRLLTGHSLYCEKLEQSIATFHGYPSGLIFNCGYMANVGLLSSIANNDNVILFDSHVHASTHDGIRLSKAVSYPFKHNDPEHLEYRLKKLKTKKCFVCIESIYSMDGSITPLKDIHEVCVKYQAHLIVDEAHAVGVLGPHGKGLVAENNLCEHVFAQIITFGKALGCCGAIILGSSTLKNYLVNFARSFIYTTALPHQMLASIKCSYQIFPTMQRERDKIQTLAKHFQNNTSIQMIKIPGNYEVKKMSKYLLEVGLDVRPIMSPTVRRGGECLRICLHAFNTDQEVELLIKTINTFKL